MNVCAGCTHEYDEEFKFCPECGHRFGGAATETATAAMNQHLRSMANSAQSEEQKRRAFLQPGGFDRAPGFQLSDESRERVGRLWAEMEAGLTGTALEDDGFA